MTRTQLLIGLKVKAGARANDIFHYIEIDGKKYLQIAVKVRAEAGRANKEVINFLSKILKIPRADVEIIRGSSSSFKILAIKNIDEYYLNSVLVHYIK